MRLLLALALGVIAVSVPASASDAEQPSGRFVFISNATTTADVLWTIEADGAGKRKLTQSRSHAEYDPEWSPDGSKIAFSRSRDCPRAPLGSCYSVWTANADGSGERRLTPLKLPGRLAHRVVSFDEPTWSPGGQQIAYVQFIEATDTSNLFVMNSDGTGRRRLTRLGDASGPAWSPDGAGIAFSHTQEGQHDADLYTVALATGEVHRLTRTVKADESLPRWSPDGRQIAYERLTSGQRSLEYEVFVMNADGTARRNLSRRPGAADGDPAWSPGGDLVGFVSDRGIDLGIYIRAADGSGAARKVPNAEPSLYGIDWGIQQTGS